MSKTNRLLLDRKVVIFWAGLIGLFAFVLCFALACAMLLLHSSATLLFSCMLAGGATFTFARFNLRWHDKAEHMRTMDGARAWRRYRNCRRADVEDVAFHEMPVESFIPPKTRQN